MKTMAVSTYSALRDRVRQILLLGQQKIDQARVQTCWQTGFHIHEHILCYKGRAEYGEGVITRLAEALNVGSRCWRGRSSFTLGFPGFRPRGRN